MRGGWRCTIHRAELSLCTNWRISSDSWRRRIRCGLATERRSSQCNFAIRFSYRRADPYHGPLELSSAIPSRNLGSRASPVSLVAITNEEENPSVAFRFRHGLSLVIWGLLGGSILLAQSRRTEDLRVGKLLVVPRQSPDPRFAES